MRRSAVLVFAALLLSGCGGGAGAMQASLAAPSPTASSPTAASPSEGARTTRNCADRSPDRGPVDLEQVSLRPIGPRLTATFRLAAPPDAVSGLLQLSVGIWSDDGTARRSLDVRWVDGAPRVRMYDVQRARGESLGARPDVAGGTVTVRFPAAATAGLGQSWRWEAFATVDGTDVDDCPAA